MDYVNRLSDVDTQDVANHALQNGFFEEAVVVYKNNNNHDSALNVLLENMGDIRRAHEYAQSVNIPEIWSRLAKAHLDDLRTKEAIDSYIHASDHTNYAQVIYDALNDDKREVKYEDLVRYLEMAHKALYNPLIASVLLFAYAKTGRMTKLKEFLDRANVDDVQRAGGRCEVQKMYVPAKLMYVSISDWAGLATTLTHLGEFQAAVDSAHKAANTRVWRKVHAACFEHKKFQLAQVCALKLLETPGVVEELFHLYEDQGYGEQLTDIVEANFESEYQNTGIFTDKPVYRAGPLLCQIPPRAADGAPQDVLEAHQHSQGYPRLRRCTPLGRARVFV